MLSKSNIAKTKIETEAWRQARLGKFTSSEIHFLTGDKFLTEGCISYINRKVGEFITDKPATYEINNESMIHGLIHEVKAVQLFCKQMGISFIVCQQLVTIEGTRYGSTPDGIIVHAESTDKLSYNVSTVEVKCPPTYTAYVELALCETPQDVKRANKQYYWQVLDQMLNCDCMKGYFVVYHPDFKHGNMRIIEFRKMQPTGIEYGKEVKFPIVSDINFLQERKKMADARFEEVHQKLVQLGVV